MKFKLTAKKLKSLGVCPVAIEYVKSLLPAVISTDPEDNIKLVEKAIYLYDSKSSCFNPKCKWHHRDLISDLWFLLRAKNPQRYTPMLQTRGKMDVDSLLSSGRPSILEITQILSFIAEA